jgi:secondary thiamine-phosphate synthase enzyme
MPPLRIEMETFTIQTHSREELIDITSKVKETIDSSGIKNGMCFVYVPHTTAGVTINENADPSVKADILMTFRNMIPDSLPYTHSEGNSPAHVKATLVGSSIALIIENGYPVLGTWQGVFFCEFDGPRRRNAYVKVTSA